MKRKTAAVLAVVLSMSLTACGDGGKGDNETTEVHESAFYTEILSSTDTDAAASEITTEAVSETEISDISSSETEVNAEKVISCSEITSRMLESVSMSSMAEVGYDRITMYLDLELSENDEFSMYICGSGGFADEIFVMKTGDLDIDTVNSAVEKRIEARKKDFEGYNPDEFEKLENYFCKSSDGYFVYAVTADNDTCESVFDEYVK